MTAQTATKTPAKMIYSTLPVAKMLRGKMEKQHPGTTFDIVHVTTGYQIVRVTKGVPSAMFGKPAPVSFTKPETAVSTIMGLDLAAHEPAQGDVVLKLGVGSVVYFTLPLKRTTGSWYYFDAPVGQSTDKWVHKNHVVSIAKEGDLHKFSVPLKVAKAKGYIEV